MEKQFVPSNDVTDQEKNNLAREAVFWDAHVHARRKFFRRNWYRQVNRYMWTRTLALLGDLTNCRVLFVGCGESASITKEMARRGGEIWCLDISPQSLEQFSKHPFGDLRGRIHPVVGDAENMSFEKGSFDVVVGKAIVHHLDIGAFMKELRRVCIPEAKIVFCEPLATNPLISLFRRLTPSLRVPDEHPFEPKHIEEIKTHCTSLSLEYREFLTAASFPLFVLGLCSVARCVYFGARAAERVLFTLLPPTKWLAWSVILVGRLSPSPDPNAGHACIQ